MISQVPKTTTRRPRLLLFSSRDLRIIKHEKGVPEGECMYGNSKIISNKRQKTQN